jgi:hypothetical protein
VERFHAAVTNEAMIAYINLDNLNATATPAERSKIQAQLNLIASHPQDFNPEAVFAAVKDDERPELKLTDITQLSENSQTAVLMRLADLDLDSTRTQSDEHAGFESVERLSEADRAYRILLNDARTAVITQIQKYTKTPRYRDRTLRIMLQAALSLESKMTNFNKALAANRPIDASRLSHSLETELAAAGLKVYEPQPQSKPIPIRHDPRMREQPEHETILVGSFDSPHSSGPEFADPERQQQLEASRRGYAQAPRTELPVEGPR